MSIRLNHTIVHTHDKTASVVFLTEILGLTQPVPYGHFLTLQLDNEISLDLIETNREFNRQHYAFLVSEGALRKSITGQIIRLIKLAEHKQGID